MLWEKHKQSICARYSIMNIICNALFPSITDFALNMTLEILDLNTHPNTSHLISSLSPFYSSRYMTEYHKRNQWINDVWLVLSDVLRLVFDGGSLGPWVWWLQMGQWTGRDQPVEVFLREGGDPVGDSSHPLTPPQPHRAAIILLPPGPSSASQA